MKSRQTLRVIAAGTIGNVLEWYDFAIYGYFATAIGRQFFPHEDPVAQLLSAFGVFALGYLMRPVGGALIGHIGDRLGRRAALTFSVAAMAIPTFLIGLLPGYATLGLLAPIALTLLRMVQGLSVGGEYTSSMVFLVERAPEGRRGLMGALTSCGACGGILLGSAVGAGFAAMMPTAALESWGWRIPFLLGLVVGIAGYFLRRHVLDTVPAEPRKRAPIVETLHDHWRIVARIRRLVGVQRRRLLCQLRLSRELAADRRRHSARARTRNQLDEHGAPAPAHDRDRASVRPHRAQAGSAGRNAAGLRRRGAGVLAAEPSFGVLLAFLGQLVLVVMIGTYGGTQPTIMVEAAPAPVRCTAVALGYNICLGVIGGLTPLAATWLVSRTGDEISPAFLIMAAAAVTFATILRFRETYRAPFVGSPAAATAYA